MVISLIWFLIKMFMAFGGKEEHTVMLQRPVDFVKRLK